MTDIFKRRYTVTPEVFKVTKITPKGKEITQFDMTEPTIEYGKPEKTKDLIDIKKIREGIEVTQTRQPEISEVGFSKRVGVGELTIKEKSGFRRDFEPLLRSKKAGLLQETVLETRKPIVKIEPTAKPKGIQISTPKFKLTESFRTTLLPVNIQRQRQTTSTTNIKASIKATPTTRLEPMAQPAIKTQPITSVKPITQPIIKVSPISKTSPLSATSQITSPSPSPRYGDPPPPPPPFDPPPPLPFAFGGLYLPERQTRKRKYKGKFKRQINPTIKGIVFNTGELQSITGLYGVGGR